MGKLLQFTPRTPAVVSQPLNEDEVKACELAATIRSSFTDELVEQIKQELGQEDEDED